jgi:hypothetical protein
LGFEMATAVQQSDLVQPARLRLAGYLLACSVVLLRP